MSKLRIRVFTAVGAALLATMLLFAAGSHYAGHHAQRAAPPVALAQKIELRGLPNFARVTETLYRGAQPTTEGFAELKKLGIEIVVNFRDETHRIAAERRQVEALGLRYVSIPWNSRHRPANPQVAEFLELLRANPQRKFFVHCHHGADRTGVMVAAYRIALQNWTPPQALEEMDAFHFHRFWLHHLKSYVEDFPRQFVADPSFRALRPAALPFTP